MTTITSQIVCSVVTRLISGIRKMDCAFPPDQSGKNRISVDGDLSQRFWNFQEGPLP